MYDLQYVRIGAGNGLHPTGDRPLPERILSTCLTPKGANRPQRVYKTSISRSWATFDKTDYLRSLHVPATPLPIVYAATALLKYVWMLPKPERWLCRTKKKYGVWRKVYSCKKQVFSCCYWFIDGYVYLWPAPSHYLNQCWVIVNWTLTNEIQWNRNLNLRIFIHKNATENVVWETAAILSRP